MAGLPRGEDRRHLARILGAAGRDERADALVAWAGALEVSGRIAEAVRAVELALELRPDQPAYALHAARMARKADDPARARRFYDLVVELDDGDGRLARLASVGRALVSRDPEPELQMALRGARLAGDPETAAVAQEARAQLRRERGDFDGAVRDYLVAAARYQDPLDSARVGHELADLLTSAGDPTAARLVLMQVERYAPRPQALWAQARLLDLSRALGDAVGARRWADAPTPPLVALTHSRARPGGSSRERRLSRWMRRLSAWD